MTSVNISHVVDDPRNAGVVRYMQQRNERRCPPYMAVADSPHDPYWEMGSHPEVVERIWNQLAQTLPQECRCLIYGTPSLVAPKSGIIFALAFGTQYVLRIAKGSIDVALKAGGKRGTRWSDGTETDVQRELGDVAV
jgi:hypothetical protein